MSRMEEGLISVVERYSKEHISYFFFKILLRYLHRDYGALIAYELMKTACIQEDFGFENGFLIVWIVHVSGMTRAVLHGIFLGAQ